MIITVWGSRGSVPTPGAGTIKYGGNTSCVTAQLDDIFIILDAGTGIRVFGEHLVKTGAPFTGHLFFSHMHWDHIQGFPFFAPAYMPGNALNIYKHEDIAAGFDAHFNYGMKSPNFPVGMKEMGADIRFSPLTESVEIKSGGALLATVSHVRLNHPDPTLGYRIQDARSGKSFVYASDTEHFPGKVDENLARFAMGADVLLCDAQYTDEEYYGLNQTPPKKGWGHSTWKEGLKLASASQVPHLLLFHHDPGHDDETQAAIEREAKKYLTENRSLLPGVASVEMAYEGMTLDLD